MPTPTGRRTPTKITSLGPDTRIEEFADGTKQWYKGDLPHRDDGPAIEWANGIRTWYQDGMIHRVDGPAMIWPNGDQHWMFLDKLHREGGPAVILHDGTQKYYQHGRLFRVGGPAIINPDGTQEWWLNDRRHREDGPAIVRPNGNHTWLLWGSCWWSVLIARMLADELNGSWSEQEPDHVIVQVAQRSVELAAMLTDDKDFVRVFSTRTSPIAVMCHCSLGDPGLVDAVQRQLLSPDHVVRQNIRGSNAG